MPRTLINRLEAEGVFDTVAVKLIAAAFDDAWATLFASGAPFARDSHRDLAREIVAKHIIEMARLGERDRVKLSQSALLELTKANLNKPRDKP